MFDTGLADRIRAKGVRVVEVAGWRTRGISSGFAPRGAGHHHTAGSPFGTAPSLGVIIDGRVDVPGPLAQVLQSREANPWNDIAYVCAAGKANHGGVGTWTGRSGTMDSNYESEGLEVEHIGTTAVDPVRHEISARILAAMLEAPGSSRDASMVWEHFEYARPLGRKVDFRFLTPYDAGWIRGRAGFWVGRTTQTEPLMEDDDMPYYIRNGENGGAFRIGVGAPIHQQSLSAYQADLKVWKQIDYPNGADCEAHLAAAVAEWQCLAALSTISADVADIETIVGHLMAAGAAAAVTDPD